MQHVGEPVSGVGNTGNAGMQHDIMSHDSLADMMTCLGDCHVRQQSCGTCGDVWRAYNRARSASQAFPAFPAGSDLCKVILILILLYLVHYDTNPKSIAERTEGTSV